MGDFQTAFRIVAWNCNGGLNGDKAAHLARLSPDIAVVPECAQDAEVPGLVRLGWTGVQPRKGLGVFARAALAAAVDPAWDDSYEWFLPVHVVALDLDVLAVWAMNHRGGEGPRTWRTLRALGHYAPFLGRGRAILSGDFNDNLRWDRPAYPVFARMVKKLGDAGYASVYHARSGEQHGAETGASLYWRRSLDDQYLVDHAFVPMSLVPSVVAFELGGADEWLSRSDHMPLVLDLDI